MRTKASANCDDHDNVTSGRSWSPVSTMAGGFRCCPATVSSDSRAGRARRSHALRTPAAARLVAGRTHSARPM